MRLRFLQTGSVLPIARSCNTQTFDVEVISCKVPWWRDQACHVFVASSQANTANRCQKSGAGDFWGQHQAGVSSCVLIFFACFLSPDHNHHMPHQAHAWFTLSFWTMLCICSLYFLTLLYCQSSRHEAHILQEWRSDRTQDQVNREETSPHSFSDFGSWQSHPVFRADIFA